MMRYIKVGFNCFCSENNGLTKESFILFRHEAKYIFIMIMEMGFLWESYEKATAVHNFPLVGLQVTLYVDLSIKLMWT